MSNIVLKNFKVTVYFPPLFVHSASNLVAPMPRLLQSLNHWSTKLASYSTPSIKFSDNLIGWLLYDVKTEWKKLKVHHHNLKSIRDINLWILWIYVQDIPFKNNIYIYIYIYIYKIKFQISDGVLYKRVNGLFIHVLIIRM